VTGALSRVCIRCLLSEVDGHGPLVRIGEVSRRTGVSVELLRAWETRYRLLRPKRTVGGFRLYSDLDAARVQRMRSLLGSGLSAAQAARTVLQEEAAGTHATTVPLGIVEELDRGLLAFDEPGTHATLDRLFSSVVLEAALEDAILPELRSIGDRWAAGEVTVAQEHFASTLVRGRLLALARGWDRGRGHRAVLACVPGELHDIGLMCFGLVLRRQGWRILYLGQDTPPETAASAVRRSRATAFVAASVDRRRFTAVADELADLGQRATVAIGGKGATDVGARRMHAMLLAPQLSTGATQLTSAAPTVPGRRRGKRRAAAGSG